MDGLGLEGGGTWPRSKKICYFKLWGPMFSPRALTVIGSLPRSMPPVIIDSQQVVQSRKHGMPSGGMANLALTRGYGKIIVNSLVVGIPNNLLHYSK